MTHFSLGSSYLLCKAVMVMTYLPGARCYGRHPCVCQVYLPVLGFVGYRDHSFLNLFYWSIIDSQCCVSFCCTAKWLILYNSTLHILIHLKRPWCWEGLRAEGEGDDRGWDGWMASPTQSPWVWMDSRTLVGDGQGGLVCCGSWGHKQSDTTEQLNWTELRIGGQRVLAYDW